MREQKLIIMQGIPGSGKSYYARELLKKDKSDKTVIVNRDIIRSMMGEYWVPKREGLVTEIELASIRAGLQDLYTVIVDAINLNPKTLRSLHSMAKEENVKVELHPIKVTPTQAFIQILWRKLLGGRYISLKVVKGFYNRYKDIVEI